LRLHDKNFQQVTVPTVFGALQPARNADIEADPVSSG
jgi:hypothetical protein